MEIIKHFIDKIITKEDLIFFLQEINSLEKFVFEKEKNFFFKKLEEVFGKEFKDFFLSQPLEEQLFLFKKIKEEFQNLPQLKLEIAFQPDRGFILRLKKWLDEEVGQGIILDIFFDPDVVGGAIVEYQGKYFDFSLGKEIDNLQLEGYS